MKYLPAITTLTLTTACTHPLPHLYLFKYIYPMPPQGWTHTDTLDFTFYVTDTTSKMIFYLVVRHTNQYPYRNLWIHILTHMPDGTTEHKTIEVELADQYGNWWGAGTQGTYEAEIPILMDARFPMQGKYVLLITHQMRMDTLPGIEGIGLALRRQKYPSDVF